MTAAAPKQKLTWFRPDENTKFHIDYSWWELSGRNFRLYLRDQLCTECRDRFQDHRNTEDVDWIDPETERFTAQMPCGNVCAAVARKIPTTSTSISRLRRPASASFWPTTIRRSALLS